MKLFRRVTGWLSALLISLALLGAPGPDTGLPGNRSWLLGWLGTWECYAASIPVEWDQPAASLTDQIAAILGPGQATLALRNLSSIANADLPVIRALLEKDLKTHSLQISTIESANAIRVTLSQNDRERLWVAEITEGNQTRVVMVSAGPNHPQAQAVADYMTLRREQLPILNAYSGEPIMASLETGASLILLRPEAIDLSSFGAGGWQHQKDFPLNDHRQLSRDSRGILLPAPDGNGFTAFTGQAECSGTYLPSATTPAHPADGWTIRCHTSDEPWPILKNTDSAGPVTIKAFYNAARDFYTGVITPSLGVDLPPFYSAALLQRANGTALLIGAIDGKVQIVDSTALKPVSGTRDWGSDFAVLKSGCGSGAQVIASGSGEAATDSLRAYELPADEAIPASAPLPMNGEVTALWPAPDGKSVLASVRLASGDYEVDRVTALCN